MPHMDNVARLVLPPSAQPKFQCEVCGEGFYEVASMVNHVKRCVKRNRDSIEAVHDEHLHKDPLYDATNWEAIEWQRKQRERER